MLFTLATDAPGIQRLIHHLISHAPASRGRLLKFCDSPNEIAYSPADCGVRPSREVSAPLTMVASWSSAAE